MTIAHVTDESDIVCIHPSWDGEEGVNTTIYGKVCVLHGDGSMPTASGKEYQTLNELIVEDSPVSSDHPCGVLGTGQPCTCLWKDM